MGVVDVGGVELASVVRQLRAELNEALADAEGERLRFELGPVEMSLRVTVSQEGGAGAKVRFWVIEAGADAKLNRPGFCGGSQSTGEWDDGSSTEVSGRAA